MSYRSSEHKQKERREWGKRIHREPSGKRAVTMKIGKSGVQDSGGELEVGSPTSQSTRACAGVPSAF